LPGLRAVRRGFSLDLAPFPYRYYPCYLEALERKMPNINAVHRNDNSQTQQITDALEKWRPHSA
jgi:hypothetical protein